MISTFLRMLKNLIDICQTTATGNEFFILNCLHNPMSNARTQTHICVTCYKLIFFPTR